MVTSHPYMEDYVVLPTKPAIRADDRDTDHDVSYKLAHEDRSTPRWCAATWINVLIEKHAWLSAGLLWMPHASDSGIKGSYADSKSDALESRPTINLFEFWEDGFHLCKLATGRNYYFPKCLVVSCSIARRVLFDHQPLEPEMWLTLFAQKFPQCVVGTLMDIRAPIPGAEDIGVWSHGVCPSQLREAFHQASGDLKVPMEFMDYAHWVHDYWQFRRSLCPSWVAAFPAPPDPKGTFPPRIPSASRPAPPTISSASSSSKKRSSSPQFWISMRTRDWTENQIFFHLQRFVFCFLSVFVNVCVFPPHWVFPRDCQLHWHCQFPIDRHLPHKGSGWMLYKAMLCDAERRKALHIPLISKTAILLTGVLAERECWNSG